MTRGIYTAASGMLAGQFFMDTIAGNLANINTTGYKQDRPSFRSLQELAINRIQDNGAVGPEIGMLGTGVSFDGLFPDMVDGALQKTGTSTDLALSGDGLMVLQTPEGERYTRDGQLSFRRNDQSQLVLSDANGYAIQGERGSIVVDRVVGFSVSKDGTITNNGKRVDKLKFVSAPPSAVVKEGRNIIKLTEAPVPAKPEVTQGYLEQSNVNSVETMVRMIAIQRNYEACAKALSAQDDTLGKAVNEAGRV